MRVVAHQCISVQLATETRQTLRQALQVTRAIAIVEETRQPIVAALDDSDVSPMLCGKLSLTLFLPRIWEEVVGRRTAANGGFPKCVRG